MKYHDNKVYFSVATGYSIVSGRYTIAESSVSSGQDPDGYLKPGKSFTCGKNGGFTFKAGMSMSKTVANWFKARIKANQTTFNHEPGKLYFAMLGTLELTITGGIFASGHEVYTFDNIALAEGYSWFEDNWWFGGKSCQLVREYYVSVKGRNATGVYHNFEFRRGGSGNNTDSIVMTPQILLRDTKKWMKDVQDTVTLNNIMMPGSHDAGMSVTNNCAPPGIDGSTKTQSGNVQKQLEGGSRYFDLRIDYDKNQLVTYHRWKGTFGCNGQALKSILDGTRNFLKANPTETAIFRFSQTRDALFHNEADIQKRINEMLDEYSDYLYKSTDKTINLGKVPLSSARGKMIMVFDYPADNKYLNTSKGRFRYKDGTSTAEKNNTGASVNIAVYDVYADKEKYEEMKKNQLDKWAKYGGMGKDYLFLLSWTLTGGNVEKNAAIANGNLPGVLYDQIVVKKSTKPNIVYIDFLTDVVTQSIIQYNF